MTPLARYRRECQRADFSSDPEQETAIAALDRVHRELAAARRAEQHWWVRLIRCFVSAPRQPVKGLYLCGGVGRGKTMLVDLFYECVPVGGKRRIHFHSFMREVHHELKSLRGIADPLQVVAERWARDLRVLCLDEFHVVDITDAMLLAQLLSALFARGVTLITTSNELPDDLYRGGLQRERFLPAIALLKAQLEVIVFFGTTDYRLRTLTQAATYYAPADTVAEQSLRHQFLALTHASNITAATLTIEGREVSVKAAVDGVAWFEFATLCDSPRSTADYIEIACCFHTVLVSNVPAFNDDANDAARRFINLVDEFYDRGVNLLVTAVAAPEQLYRGQRLAQQFRRTTSRLSEMQSAEYLAKPHLSDGTSSIKSDS